MKIIGIILILIGIAGIFVGSLMFGDIGVAAMIGSLAALFSGIGFFRFEKKVKQYAKEVDAND
ncbi:hypothetical protein DER71_12018 [Halanaerobium sp. DL-01]|uniref:hypothetical protein n=1 Tax=Halanaerobium sp. DL-01 TaxID=1653064 RepID=UPI000DF29943|nr:hypothetical protein [Halanaerobium sp. DL-01]RCW82522.1 hypothetical protein DER71_12018 [Halanaerobium sp. DL-01]